MCRKKILFASVLFIIVFSVSRSAIAHAGQQRAKWTVLIYMAGENNLASAVIGDLKEMLAAEGNPQVNVVVQAEVSRIYTPQFADGVTHRFQILGGSLKNFPLGYNVDMASPAELASFIRWGVGTFPAQRYCLVLWDHGLGWRGGNRSGGGWNRGLLEDEGSHSFMSLSGLKTALDEAGVIFNLIEFDACLMGMWEVAATIYDRARYISFSETTEPGDGDPYDLILGKLSRQPEMNGAELGRTIVEQFVSYYSRSPHDRASVTKSVIDPACIPELNSGLEGLAKALDDILAQKGQYLYSTRLATQAFDKLPGSIDLWDFCDRLDSSDRDVREQARSVIGILKNRLVLESRHFTSPDYVEWSTGQGNVDHAHGLAIYLPYADQVKGNELWDYKNLQVVQALPAWSKFIEDFVSYTGKISSRTATGNFILAAYWTNPRGGPSGADLDLYIIEPQGIYAPWMGQTTPNGFFSQDSITSENDYETYLARPEVTPGYYIPVVNLYDIDYLLAPSVYCYFIYLPKISRWNWLSWGPREMSFFNPAPTKWDDYVIYLLSNNYYSDWWIPTEVEKMLSRASSGAQRDFWLRIKREYDRRHALAARQND